MIQDGRVDIQTKSAGYGGNSNTNAGRQNRNQSFNVGNGNDESNQIVLRVPRTESTPGKANVQSIKDEAGSNFKDEENDFMLDNSYGDETLEELTVAVVSEVNASNKVHEQVNHAKRKTIIHTSEDDQIDSNIIFDDPYVENNGGTSEHDSNAHDEYHDIQMLEYNDTIERNLKEKDKIESDFFKIENEKLIIQHETQLAKKAFKERENRYLDDIVDLEEKLSSHDRIVYKTGQSIQKIHMLGKQPNKVYDPFLKAGLGYKNLECLKKAIAAQPKMYHGEMLHKQKTELLQTKLEKSLNDSKDIQANLLKRIKILENDFKQSQAQSIDFELKLQHQKDKMACDVSWNSRLSTLNDENVSSSVSIYSNKHETMNSTVCQSNASVLNTKTVNDVNDGSNIVCVSYGKNVFMLSYEKCVARYAFSRDFKVKRALFTTPIAAKSNNLGATSVVAKSRLSVAKTPTATNKVSSVILLSPDSSQSMTLRNYMKNKIATSRKWQKWFENQQCFNWTPKSKTDQSLPSETKSSTRVRSKSNTPVTTQKWVARMSTLPSAFFSCDAGDPDRPLDY
ncbi:hypothetical protein Tco_0452239 [Tanacetum coccineum]